MSFDPRRHLAFLADALAAEGLTEASVARTLDRLIGPLPGFSRRLTVRLVRAFPSPVRPPARRLASFLAADRPLRRLLDRTRPPEPSWLGLIPRMAPATAAETWDVPSLTTLKDLADWLGLSESVLLWMADLRNLERHPRAEALRHYRRSWIAKRTGGFRLLESPKRTLKSIQRKILDQILVRIPAHPAAHGFLPGRSIRTFAEPHCRKPMVIRLDLQEFFVTISRARVAAIFRTAGYPEQVANLLAGLCTTVTPRETFTLRAGPPSPWGERKQWDIPHLPQGAPTSPALANLSAFRLDRRLAGLASAAGLTYTRYADDLTFSGGGSIARAPLRLAATVGAIALEEGFSVNHRKTRIMSQATCQHTAGLVVNDRVAIPRRTFETLKAILHNCARHGPASQNREGHPDFRAHLAGRLAHCAAVDPRRSARLRALWDSIPWDL